MEPGGIYALRLTVLYKDLLIIYVTSCESELCKVNRFIQIR